MVHVITLCEITNHPLIVSIQRMRNLKWNNDGCVFTGSVSMGRGRLRTFISLRPWNSTARIWWWSSFLEVMVQVGVDTCCGSFNMVDTKGTSRGSITCADAMLLDSGLIVSLPFPVLSLWMLSHTVSFDTSSICLSLRNVGNKIPQLIPGYKGHKKTWFRSDDTLLCFKTEVKFPTCKICNPAPKLQWSGRHRNLQISLMPHIHRHHKLNPMNIYDKFKAWDLCKASKSFLEWTSPLVSWNQTSEYDVQQTWEKERKYKF